MNKHGEKTNKSCFGVLNTIFNQFAKIIRLKKRNWNASMPVSLLSALGS